MPSSTLETVAPTTAAAAAATAAAHFGERAPCVRRSVEGVRHSAGTTPRPCSAGVKIEAITGFGIIRQLSERRVTGRRHGYAGATASSCPMPPSSRGNPGGADPAAAFRGDARAGCAGGLDLIRYDATQPARRRTYAWFPSEGRSLS